MKKPEVILDVDGVMADFVKKYLETFTHLTGITYRPKDIDQWDIAEALKVDKQIVRQADSIVMTSNWCRELELLEGAKENVPKLRAIADVHVVTSPFRGRFWAGERIEWLIEELGFDHHDITNTHKKHKVHGDFIVDDKASTLVKWRAQPYNAKGQALLWSTFFNRNDADSSYVRISSWPELLAIVGAWCEELKPCLAGEAHVYSVSVVDVELMICARCGDRATVKQVARAHKSQGTTH